MKNKIFITFLWLLSLSAFILPIVSPDVFWHLLAGKHILLSGKVPHSDFMTWSMNGKEWFDFEWLVQIIYFSIWKISGFRGLFFLKFLLLSASLFFVCKTALLYGIRRLAFFSLPFVSAAIVTNSDLRPENFSLLFFSYLLFRLEKGRLSQNLPRIKDYALCFLFFVLWCNMHAGHLYGSALIFFYFLGEFSSGAIPLIYGRSGKINFGKSISYLKLFFVSIFAIFLNPYGPAIFKVAANHHKYLSVLQEYIQEWTPFDIFGVYQWPFAFLFFVSFITLLLRFIRKRDVPYPHIISMLFFGYSAINYSRQTPFFIIMACASFLYSMRDAVLTRGKRSLTLLFSFFIILYYPVFIWSRAGRMTDFINRSQPLVRFLESNRRQLGKLRMYNQWGWGGYMEFFLWPSYKPFIDGRYIFHSKLEEVQNCQVNYEAWRRFLQKYKFEILVLERDGQKTPVKHKFKDSREIVMWRPTYLLYIPRKDWALVHWDARLIVMVMRKSAPPEWLKKNEYKLFRADDTQNVALMALSGEVSFDELKGEVKRYLKNNPAHIEDSLHASVASWFASLEREHTKHEKNKKRD